MLTVRQRGTYWHVRGTVKAAGRARVVQEHSSGETRRGEAVAYAERLSADIQEELRGGRPAASKRLTFAEAGGQVVDARALSANDLSILSALNEHFGDTLMSEHAEADWKEYVRKRLARCESSYVDRHLYVYRMVFKEAASDGVVCPQIASPRTAQEKRKARRVRWLPHHDSDRLERAYGRAWKGQDGVRSRALAAVLRYQGVRIQEGLQIDRRQVQLGDGPHGTIYIAESKNGLARTIAMHPRTRVAILPLMMEKRPTILVPDEKRDFDPLFVNRFGQPYEDTRGEGGNPIKNKHAAACRWTGILDFTVHDWRRSWACWCLKSGMDPWTLMKLGGWKDFDSVAHYVEAVSQNLDHMSEQLEKIAA